MVGVEEWAEVRRMHRVERLSIREIQRRTGLHRKTIRRALAATSRRSIAARRPVRSSIRLGGGLRSSCGPIRGSRRCGCASWPRELGYAGGKTILDDFVREVRPRFWSRRTYQRTVYRPGELCQFDLWEPREPVAVGHGQTRRGWVVTAELRWSRALAGALVFSKEWPDIAVGHAPLPRPAGCAAGEAGLGPRGRHPRRRRAPDRPSSPPSAGSSGWAG